MNLKQKIEEWEKTKKEISPWPWRVAGNGSVLLGIHDKDENMGSSGSFYAILETDGGFYGPDLKTGLFIASAPENYDAAMQALKEAAEVIKHILFHEDYMFDFESNEKMKGWRKKWGFEE